MTVVAIACMGLAQSAPSSASPGGGHRVFPVAVEANDNYPGHPATNLFDGNLGTKWVARPNADGKNVTVFDFGSDVELVGITVYHAQSGGEGINLNTEDFHVEFGPSGNGPWTLLFQVIDNLDDRTPRTFAPVRTRFVRLVVDDAMSMNKANAKNDDNYARIPEIEFFGRKANEIGAAVSPSATAPLGSMPPGEAPPFLRMSGGQVPQAVGVVRPATGAASAPPPAPAVNSPTTRSGAAPGPMAPPFALYPTSAPTASTQGSVPPAAAAAWTTDITRAAHLAAQRKVPILVYFRSDASKYQAASDAILLDVAFLPLLQRNNVLLVLDLKSRPQDGAKFNVLRTPTLAQWTVDGKELIRLWGDEITRQNITSRFRL